MVAERRPEQNGSYEEQVAIARANLERHVEEAQRRREAWQAEHGDPAEALDALVREMFPDPEPLLTAWREWRAERGKPPIEGW